MAHLGNRQNNPTPVVPKSPNKGKLVSTSNMGIERDLAKRIIDTKATINSSQV